jgi:hypothetical protein
MEAGMSNGTLDAIESERTSRVMRSRLTVALLAALGLSGIAIAAETGVVAPEHFQKIVEVRDVRAQPDQVTAVLVNLSSKPLRGIHVRIDHSWLWTNERHPGQETDNPGRSVVYAVPGEIAPGGRLLFTYRPDAISPGTA